MHDHTLQERNPAIWSQQNRKTGTQNTFVLSVKPSVFKGCRGRAIFYFPIWWGQAPRLIETFVEAHDLSGKTVLTFCTSASSGYGRTGEILAALTDGTVNWIEGARFSASTTAEEMEAWLAEKGIAPYTAE